MSPLPPAFPTVAPVTPGIGTLTVAAGTSQTLTASTSYEAIVVETGATLYLDTGAHRVATVTTSTNATIIALDRVDLRIADALLLGADSVLTTTTGFSAGDLRIDVAGFNSPPDPLATVRAVEFGDRAEVRAIIFAPNGTAWVGEDAVVDGVIFARDVWVDFGATVAFEDGRDPYASDAPVAFSDRFSVSEDATLDTGAPGVTWNDYDPNSGDTLTAELVSGTTSGTVALSADGSFVYTPHTNFTGQDFFTYRVTDGTYDSSTATVTITVDDQDDAPLIVSEPVRTAFVGALWRYVVDVTDADTDEVLTFSLDSGAPSGMTISSTTGVVTWTPGSGDVDVHVFTVRVTDSTSLFDTQTRALEVTATPLVEDFTVYGAESVQLDAAGKFGGDIGAGVVGSGPYLGSGWWGTARTTIGGFVDGRTFGESVALDYGVYVEDIYATDLVHDQASVRGVLTSLPSMPSLAGTTTVAVAGTLNVAASTTQTLSAGAATATITIGADACLELEEGTHAAGHIDVGEGGCIVALGPIVLRVNGRMDLAQGAYLGQADGANLSAEQIQVFVHGSNGGSGGPTDTPYAFEGGYESSVNAHVSAPNGTLYLGQRSVNWGSFTGQHVYAGVESSTHYEGDDGGAFAGSPVFLTTELVTVNEGQTYTYDAHAVDYDPGDRVTYRLMVRPSSEMNVDEDTGVVTWATTSADVGTHPVILRAEDLAGNYVDQDYDLTVVNVNDAPSLAGNTDVTVGTVGQPYAYSIDATDPDLAVNPSEDLTFSLDTSPAGMSINESDEDTALITWTPAANQAGTSTVTVRVTDAGGLFDTRTFYIDVASGNQPPTITSSPVLTVSAGTGWTYRVESTDPDPGDVPTYTLTENPDGMVIDEDSGLILWRNTVEGSHDFTVVVTDVLGATDSNAHTLVVEAVNRPPQIVSTAPTMGIVGAEYSYDVDASDPDGDTLIYAIVSGPQNALIDRDTGMLTWTPAVGDLSGASFVIRAQDPDGAEALDSFPISVYAPPSAAPMAAFTTARGNNVSSWVDGARVVAVSAGSLNFAQQTIGNPSGSTGWRPLSNANEWMEVDLAGDELEVIDRVLLSGYSASTTQSINHFEVAVSTDTEPGGAFTTVFAGQLEADAYRQEFTFAPVRARFVRLTMISNHGAPTVSALPFLEIRNRPRNGGVVSLLEGGAQIVSATDPDVDDAFDFSASSYWRHPASTDPIVATLQLATAAPIAIDKLTIGPESFGNSMRTFELRASATGSADDDFVTLLRDEYDFNGANSAALWTRRYDFTATDAQFVQLVVFDSWSPGIDVPINNVRVYSPALGGLTVSFDNVTDLSDALNYSYAWDFGDGRTSTETHPTHTYADGGTYNVTLTVTDAGGLTSTASAAYTAIEPPVIDFESNPDPIYEGDVVAFTSLATAPSGTIAAYAWLRGDQAPTEPTYVSAAGVSPIPFGGQSYPVDGTVMLEHRILDGYLVEGRGTLPVEVLRRAPTSTVDGAHDLYWGEPWRITSAVDDHLDSISCVWVFGDGTPDASLSPCQEGYEQDVVHAYDQPGDYVARLNAYDEDGVVGYGEFELRVHRRPSAILIAGTSTVVGSSVYVEAYVVDEYDGRGRRNGLAVVFDSGATSVATTTDANGRASALIPFSASTALPVTVTFDGNVDYEASSGDYTFTTYDGSGVPITQTPTWSGNEGSEFYAGIPSWSWEPQRIPEEDRLTQFQFASRVPTIATVYGPAFGTAHVAIQPGVVTQLQLPREIDPGPFDVGGRLSVGGGFRITSPHAISVTQLQGLRAALDSALLIPRPRLGSDYVTPTFPAVSFSQESYAGYLNAVGVTDSTTIYVDHSTSAGSPSGPTGSPFNVAMNALDFLQVSGAALTGARATSTNDFAFYGAHGCLFNPTSSPCNGVIEQVVPVSSLGQDFLVVPFAGRASGSTIRVVAAHDNTTVSIDGTQATTLQAEEFYEFTHDQTEYFHVTTSQPVLVYQVAFGSLEEPDFNLGTTLGDPTMVQVVPTEQFGQRYTFHSLQGFEAFHLATGSSVNFENHATIIVPTASTAGVLVDEQPVTSTWTAIGSSGYAAAHVDLGQGSHTVRHVVPSVRVGTYAYGWEQADAYAHPAGMHIARLHGSCQTSSTVAGDGYDNDCDNLVDEELANGIDDDGDGQVDEDLALELPTSGNVPLAFDQTRAVAMNTPSSGIVMGAFDADGDTLRWDIVAMPTNGSLARYEGLKGMFATQTITSTTNVGPIVRYVPDTDYEGADSFTFEVTDQNGTSNVATVSIDVRRPNTRPVITSEPPTTVVEGSMYTHQLTADDPDQDNSTLIFGAHNAPEGMTVSESGQVSWAPEDPDVGEYPVSFTVTDAEGSRSSYFLFITVQDLAEPPVYVSNPSTIAYANTLYTATATAIDPDVGSTVRYTVVSGPSTLNYDFVTGMLSWVPSPADVGSPISVVLRATDTADQLYDELPLTLNVRPTNTAPILDPANPPLALAAPFDDYDEQLVALDPDVAYGDTVTFTEVSVPTGMNISSTGVVTWQPTTGQLGTHQVSVLLTDDFGATTLEYWYIHVRSLNHPPRFVSTPVQAAFDGATYSYAVQVEDPDNGDTPTLALATAPSWLALNGNTLSGAPATADVGQTHAVSLTATDRESAVTPQNFVIYVSASNNAPTITSSPPLVATQGTGYIYPLVVDDPDPLDTLTYVVSPNPGGMTVTAAGTMLWTPSATQVGPQIPAGITVTDSGGLQDMDTWNIDVANVNDAPTITSSPVATASEGQPYQYVVAVTDPDAPNDDYILILEDGPPGLQLDATADTLFFTPTTYDIGFHPVALRVIDNAGATGVQTFTLNVTDTNDPPEITSTPSLLARQGEYYEYRIRMRDPDANETHTYFLDQGPVDMNVDILTGILDFTPTIAQIGQHTVTVRVNDSHQATVTQTFTLDVVADTTDPEVTVTFTPPLVTAGQSSVVAVVATDNVSVASITLTVDGQAVALNGNNQATIQTSTTSTGVLTAIATATDPAGNQATDTAVLGISDPSDVTAPVVQIVSPAETSTTVPTITEPTDIFVTVTDANVLEWHLTVRPTWGTSTPVELAWGTSQVTDAVVAEFDPTVLENGMYMLELTATDLGGLETTDEATLQVEGNMKIGVFTLSFVDLAIPVSGIPITVTRTYDSRVKTTEDFGVGWTLDVAAGRYFNNRRPGDGWEIVASGPPNSLPCQVDQELLQHRTEVRLSDQEFYSFVPQLINMRASVGTCVADWVYVQSGGSSPGATLEPLDTSPIELFNNGGALIDTNTGAPFDPQIVQLTTHDGRIYDVDQDDGVVRMEDRNGNELFINASGIVHESGQSIYFVRDTAGRITQIIDPMGETLGYVYDANGDLVSFTDREGNTTLFTYAANHYLEGVINPLGVRAVRSEYDATGRLVATIDPDGNRIDLTHNVSARIETTQDRLGYTTTFEYDARGNVTRRIDALSNETTYTYDASDNELSVTDALGRTSTKTYDQYNRVLTFTDFEGHTTTLTRNSAGQVLSSLDARGRLITNVYDAQGNLTSTTDGEGATTSYVYNAAGNPTLVTDALGQTTTVAYDLYGNETSRTDPLGNVTTTAYDVNGQRTSVSRVRTLADGSPQTLTNLFGWSADGKPTTTQDAAGFTTEIVYDALGKPSSVIAKNGATTTYVQDAHGRLTEIRYIDGTSDMYTYDLEGRTLTETDRLGNTTSYQYDALGRRTRVTHPDLSFRTTTYDAIGRVLTETDERGGVTSYAYGPSTVTVTDPNSNATVRELNEDEQPWRITDARSNVTTLTYDFASDRHGGGRLVRTDFADGTHVSSGYDALGRKTSDTDQAGRTTHFGFDALGRLTSVTDTSTQTWTYGYDEAGNRTSITDPLSRVTLFEFDAMGRMTRRELPLGQFETMTYDAMGNMVSKTDFNGATTTYSYDIQNRMQVRALPGEAPVSFGYDALGRRVSASTGRQWVYDSRGRVVEDHKPTGDVLAYGYDATGNRTSLTGPHATVTYAFDAGGRLSTVTGPTGTFTYGYDANGNETSLAFPNGVVTTRGYDTLNRLSLIETVGPGSSLVAAYDYLRDATGRIIEVDEGHSGRLVAYGYDAAYRLDGETITESSNNIRVVTYNYDAVGNRVSRNDSVRGSTTYTYDGNDRLTSLTSSVGTISLYYDQNGNLLQRGSDAFGYDARNLMISASDGTAGYGYGYDVDGARVTRYQNGLVVEGLLVDHQMPNHEAVRRTDGSGTEIEATVFGADRPLMNVSSVDGIHYLHADAQRSVRFMTSDAAAVIEAFSFDAFGAPLPGGLPVASSNQRLFGGEVHDSETGLIYLRARQYNPEDGRFLGVDPFLGVRTSPSSLHRYTYASSDPVGQRDPSGMVSISQVSVSIGIASTLSALSLDAFASGAPKKKASLRDVVRKVEKDAAVKVRELASKFTHGMFKKYFYRDAKASDTSGVRQVKSVLRKIAEKLESENVTRIFPGDPTYSGCKGNAKTVRATQTITYCNVGAFTLAPEFVASSVAVHEHKHLIAPDEPDSNHVATYGSQAGAAAFFWGLPSSARAMRNATNYEAAYSHETFGEGIAQSWWE
ncbi:MAG: tandem-95 repeat protein [Deltaproteobacteria bacterium]